MKLINIIGYDFIFFTVGGMWVAKELPTHKRPWFLAVTLVIGTVLILI